LIYEIATLSSFLFLILIFIINTYQVSFIKEVTRSEVEYLKFSKKLNALKITLLVFIVLLLVSKLILLLFGPDTLLKESAFSSAEILIFVVNFFYAILWLLISLFLIESKEVKHEFILVYLKKISNAITLLFFLDFVIEGIVYLTTITDYLTFSVYSAENSLAESLQDTLLPIIVIIILTILLVALFISFLIKRKIRILRYLEFNTLFLYFAIGYLVFFCTGSIIGWNESLVYLLKLFSFKYGYTGFIFLIILAVTMIMNSSVVLLFNMKQFFSSEQQLRNKIINLVKVGFIATCILSCMAIWPHVYLWF